MAQSEIPPFYTGIVAFGCVCSDMVTRSGCAEKKWIKMNIQNTNYVKKILILTAIVALVMVMAFLAIPEYFSIALPFLLAFFLGISIVSYKILQKKAVTEPRRFISGFLAHTVVRMMIYLFIILVYSFIYRSDAVNFIIGFFILYTIFTFFEVMQFIAITRQTRK